MEEGMGKERKGKEKDENWARKSENTRDTALH
jgi:hypothetical protein